MKVEPGIISARAFHLLRKGSSSWKIDCGGLWSYPAIFTSEKNEVFWLSLILSGVPMPEKKRTALFRPKAIVIAKAGSNEVIRYESLRLGHDPFPSLSWDQPVAMYPHKGISDLSYDELEKKEAELLALYPSAQKQFKESKTFPEVFKKSYIGLIHPIFFAYLKHLAPEFSAVVLQKKSD